MTPISDSNGLRAHLALRLMAIDQSPTGPWVDPALKQTQMDITAGMHATGSSCAGVDARIAAFLRSTLGAAAPALPCHSF